MYSSAVRCMRLYKLIYVDRLKTDTDMSGDMLFGSALHSAINSSITGTDDPGEVFRSFWGSYRDKTNIEYGRHAWPQLHDLGSEFVRKFIKMHAEHYKPTLTEERLYGKYLDIAFEGTPDFYGEYKGKLSLRDFKTSGYNYPKERADISVQLYLYAYLLGLKGHKIDTLGYTVFNKGTGSIQDLTWDFKEEDMKVVLNSMVDYVKVFSSKEHEFPQNRNACLDYGRRCQYFDVCNSKEKKQ